MAESAGEFKHDPNILRQALFGLAKRRWVTTIALKVVGFTVSVAGVFWHPFALPAFYVALGCVLVSELCQLQSDAYKSLAESLLRRLESRDAFGSPISAREISDYYLQLPAGARKALPPEGVGDAYYNSKNPQGSERALENIRESAWFSSKQASRMAAVCWTVAALLSATAFVCLLATTNLNPGPALQVDLAKFSSSLIMLLFSVGLIKLALGYSGFEKKSSDIVQEAERLLKASAPDDKQAARLQHDYQVSRAGAPLIPDRLWTLMRDELNELRGKYCAQHSPSD